MKTTHSLLYVFDTHQQAEKIIHSLSDHGVDLKNLSLIGKGYHSEEQPIGFYTTTDKMKAWGGIGAFWGGIWGLLMAPAVFFLPGLGLIAFAGPFVATLIGALEGAVVVGGVSALGAALIDMGITKENAIKYETALKADKYLLAVHGTAYEITKAREVLEMTDAVEAA